MHTNHMKQEKQSQKTELENHSHMTKENFTGSYNETGPHVWDDQNNIHGTIFLQCIITKASSDIT